MPELPLNSHRLSKNISPSGRPPLWITVVSMMMPAADWAD
jgi:hypothetical protein